MNVQLTKTGVIVSINAPQPSPDLVTIETELPIEVLRAPEHYRYQDGEFVRFIENNSTKQAKAYLAATDFYVTRKLETGIAIPREVRMNRDKCRALVVTVLPSTDFLTSEEE